MPSQAVKGDQIGLSWKNMQYKVSRAAVVMWAEACPCRKALFPPISQHYRNLLADNYAVRDTGKTYIFLNEDKGNSVCLPLRFGRLIVLRREGFISTCKSDLENQRVE